MRPGTSQPAIARPKATTTATSPRFHGCRVLSSSPIGWPGRRPKVRDRMTQRTSIMRTASGMQSAIQRRNSIGSPTWRRAAMPMRLGGVPTGVQMPPTDAP